MEPHTDSGHAERKGGRDLSSFQFQVLSFLIFCNSVFSSTRCKVGSQKNFIRRYRILDFTNAYCVLLNESTDRPRYR
jgi:hypothetical protein